VNECETDFLFASPGFLQGFASAVDLGGTLFDLATSQETDERAMENDWAMVGMDIVTAVVGLVEK